MFGFLRNQSKAERQKLKQLIMPYMQRIMASGRCSPDDEETLEKLGREFKTDLGIDEKLRVQKILWHYDNSNQLKIEPVDVDIDLEPGEICYNSCQCNLRDDNVGSRYSTAIENTRVESFGTLYITNQTVFFSGSHILGKEEFEIGYDEITEVKIKKNPAIHSDHFIHITTRVETDDEMITIFETEKAQAEYSVLIIKSLLPKAQTQI